jgi:hypothetical protein
MSRVAAVFGVTHYLCFDDTSGYAVAARRCVAALAAAGVDVTAIPFVPTWDWGLGYAPLAPGSVGGMPDTVVAHLPAEYYEVVRRHYPSSLLVAHTVWETERLPRPWLPLLEVPDLVVVPTAWNAETLARSDVSTPTAVVPHVATPAPAGTSERWDVEDGTVVFYTIAAWTARKSVWNTVRAYLRAFSADDPVLLIVKTSSLDLTYTGPAPASPVGRGTAAHALAHVVGEFPRPAAVRLVAGDVTEEEIAALHGRGRCFVSLARAEGWGIGAFDAAAYGNAVVTTAFGGHLAYLDQASAYLVDFDLVAADDPVPGTLYTSDHVWAEPSIDHAAALLRRIVDDPHDVDARTSSLRCRMATGYGPDVVAERFADAVATAPRRSA